MTQLPDHNRVDDDTTQAFEELRGEVSLTRRAVEGLTAARDRIPDYSTTLGEMAQALKTMRESLDRVERSPAVRLSPAAMVEELARASEAARAEDRQLLGQWRDVFAHSIGRMDGIVERGQAADRQWHRQIWCAVGGVAGGILLWSALPGMIARTLPESWHVPEWMAARTIGLDMSLAGERMLHAAHQDGRTAVPTLGELEAAEPHAARKPRG
jgi:hypothetical protein